MTDINTQDGSGPPAVQIVGGHPSDIEVAALVAGLAAVTGSEPAPEPAPAPSMWQDRARRLGAHGQSGTDRWRWSLHG